jgi:hypothetical protein
MRTIQRVWPLGFLGFLGIRGLVGLYDGDWLEAIWVAWFAFFAYFVPMRVSEEKPVEVPKKRPRVRKAESTVGEPAEK